MYATPRDKQKQTGAHFTPKPLADLVAQRLTQQLWRFEGPLRILDPACGDGNLLVAMAQALPAEVRRRSTLVGIEDDIGSFDTLTRRIATMEDVPPADLKMGDFLDLVDDGTMFASLPPIDPVEVVIANPPYVRTQVLGAQRAQHLAAKFGLEGRVDLYQAFLVAMAESLRPGGVLGVITSNRFLTTKAGASTRRFLRSQFDLLEIVDLGDTKLFGAAVLPALIFGVRRDVPRLSDEPMRAEFTRVYSTTSEGPTATLVESIPAAIAVPKDGRYRVNGTLFEVSTGRLEAPPDSSQPWTMHTSDEGEWVRAVDRSAACRIADVARVRVGIKTTADKVFIRDDWDDVPAERRPEDRHLRPLLSQRNAARWVPSRSGADLLRVLYTHEVRDGERRAVRFAEESRAWRYLVHHRERLESRKYVLDAGRLWYEIWVPQDPAAWAEPKIVFPDISPDARFFLDDQESIVDGNCYWITANDPRDIELLFLILGVANSSTMARYHELCFQNRLYAQRRRYLTQYVQQYPLPDRKSAESNEIIRLVRNLIHPGSGELDVAAIESEIDLLVAAAFGVGAVAVTGTAG